MRRALLVVAGALFLPALASGADWNEILRKGLDAADEINKRAQSQRPAAPAPQPKTPARQADDPPPAPAAPVPAAATPAELLPLRRTPLIVGEFGVNLIVEVDGTVLSWGDPQGEGSYLGDGTTGTRTEPAPLPGVSDIVDASVALGHSLLLRRDGTVLTWGRNQGCELTVKDERRRLTPFPVNGVSGAVSIAASQLFSAAVLRDGSVMVWGSNAGGLLANGKRESECAYTPVPVEGLTGVKKIAVSTSVLVLKDDGTVWGWGPNRNGELCDGTTERRHRPVQMKGIANAVDIAIDNDSAVVLADGTVWRCGANTNGEMAKKPEPDTVKYTTPVQIPGINSAVAVRTNNTALVRLRDGTLLGWGSGIFGALGNGRIEGTFPKPAAPIGLGPVLEHYWASNSAYAIKADGTMMAWAFFVGERGKQWQLTPVARYKLKLAD
jgi:alpha-tubulin suppressor-like RCC1 family protein